VKVPSSFYAFQRVVEQAVPASGLGTTSSNVRVNANEKVLSFFCDQILSTLHGYENLRDAVVDSRANIKNNSLLLIINPEFKEMQSLVNAVRGMDSVGRIAYASRQFPNGTVTALKLQHRASAKLK
jgi:hypothetical protein